MQPRWNVHEVFAETLHDRNGVARYSVKGGPCSGCEKGEYGKGDYPARTAARQGLLEAMLPLADQILEIGS
jgi:hypothetical protein